MAQKQLLLGDEAVALGALHAGLSGVYAYPGTPSTEITEFIQGYPLTAARNVHCAWSTNEKTAMEEALGMSFAGKRALVCMKHVGMNVCADPFMGSATTGANGGLVVAACDDPSMHSSQNEQDSRFWGNFALVPVFEPSSQQEAYDMMSSAFEYSERHGTPVLMRLTTRLSHSRAAVECIEDSNALVQNELHLPKNERRWCTLPVSARVSYNQLVKDHAQFEKDAVASPYNRLVDGPDKSLGIIACGLAYNYLMENYPDGCPHPVLKISQYPLPKELVLKLSAMCSKILVIEEGQPVVEEKLRGTFPSEITILGRL
ncbi:MAG: indolepyruvate ferredoxin oxidoreductase, partial [Bacteroidales bacterium]|nr:indolepyruvate ferredoxin oxidoreductase [Bacteroidales bacterium]